VLCSFGGVLFRWCVRSAAGSLGPADREGWNNRSGKPEGNPSVSHGLSKEAIISVLEKTPQCLTLVGSNKEPPNSAHSLVRDKHRQALRTLRYELEFPPNCAITKDLYILGKTLPRSNWNSKVNRNMVMKMPAEGPLLSAEIAGKDLLPPSWLQSCSHPPQWKIKVTSRLQWCLTWKREVSGHGMPDHLACFIRGTNCGKPAEEMNSVSPLQKDKECLWTSKNPYPIDVDTIRREQWRQSVERGLNFRLWNYMLSVHHLQNVRIVWEDGSRWKRAALNNLNKIKRRKAKNKSVGWQSRHK